MYVNEGHWQKRSNANLEPTTTVNDVACLGKEQGGVVVVSVNYRMGPYGFNRAFHGNTVQQDALDRNYALGDIRTAFVWIRKNIVHFGGDPAKVGKGKCKCKR